MADTNQKIDPWSIALSGAGDAVTMVGDYLAQQRKDRAIRDAIRNREGHQKKIDARTMQSIHALRDSNPETERKKAMGEFMQQLNSAQAVQQSRGVQGPSGVTLSRAPAAASAVNTGVAATGRREADITARTAAPFRQRLEEGLARGRLGSDIRYLMRDMDRQNFLDQLRIQRRGTANPWWGMAGKMLKGIGMGMAAGGMGGGGGYTPSGGGGNGASPPGFFDPTEAYDY